MICALHALVASGKAMRRRKYPFLGDDGSPALPEVVVILVYSADRMTIGLDCVDAYCPRPGMRSGF